jgi:dipeptidyl aminopeptidase/acylaminoacyl peptidase
MVNNERLLRDLCNLKIPTTIRFSPDGQKVLYSTQLYWGHSAGKHTISELWLAATGENNSSRQLIPGSFKDYAPAWHPDGHTIAFVSDRAQAGTKWAIYTLKTEEGSVAVPVTPTEDSQPISAFAFSPNGRLIAYLSSDEKTTEKQRREDEGEDVQVWGDEWDYARLRIVDLQSRQIRSLSLDRHVTAFCWSPEGDRLGIVTVKTPHIEEPYLTGSTISVVDVGLTDVKDLCHFPTGLSDLVWADDNKLHFIAGVPVGSLLCGHGVYSVDPNSPSPSHDWEAFGHDEDATSLTKANGKVVVKLEHRLEGRISLLDGTVLYSKKEELEAFDATYSLDSGKFVVAVATSNVNHPVEVFTTTVGDEAMVQLSSHGRKFEDRTFGTCSFLPFLSTDGEVEVDSIYLTPAVHVENDGAPIKPLPTIVLIHGGPNTRLTNAFNAYYYYLAPYLLSLGYGILIPNYRGSSGRGNRFASWAIGGAGTFEYADVIAAVQNAIVQGYTDKENLIVGGWSHGGFLSLLCSVRNGSHGHGWKFKAAVAGSSICDIDAMALTSDLASVYMPAIHEGRVVWKMAGDDTRNRTASPLWLFHDAIERGKLTGEPIIPPMLILHGANDERCHISNAEAMRRALQSEGLPFEYAKYPRQGHIFGEQNFWVDMAERVGRWCDKHTGQASISRET